MTDDTSGTDRPTSGGPADETFSFEGGAGSGTESETGRNATAREWMHQLQSMIDNVATHAGPVVRDIGAKAAELAALAGEKAGPIAHKAAEATEAAGHRIAERGREVAADLRREAAAQREAEGNGSVATAVDPAATSEPEDDRRGTRPDSADALGE